ncbi:MFS transporter [Chitinimonas sp. BJYL2]|uniref:MFS transporter n=1 Tax=Chitinimonas sp. BJYL2 TaxID=2976696 RepID=UPI0022B4D3CE|nr:MFS transporter [Chitinimonas sp. BJYL2]
MKTSGLLAYGALGLPLAMAALPVYVAAPQFYGATLGLDLAVLGAVLLFARLIDTAQDPFIGRWVDHLQARPRGWQMLMGVGASLMAVALYALFSPPALGAAGLYVWLGFCLVLVYTAHSAVNICYLAWGARLSDHTETRARVTAWREAAGLIGVLLASALPVWLAQRYGNRDAYGLFGLIFIPILALCLFWTLRGAPAPHLARAAAGPDWRSALRPPAIRKLIIIYLVNSLAVAIPATLVLFYVADVIQAPDAAGYLLLTYFLAGALTLPGWVMLADLIGKPYAWLVGMVMAYGGFFWAAGLGSGDLWQFGLVCALSGMALGADLALPPALLADLIPPEHRQDTGLYFGIWAMLGKLGLALAAGIALPLLDALGYRAGDASAAGVLALVYAGLPCALKLAAGLMLYAWAADLRPISAESSS